MAGLVRSLGIQKQKIGYEDMVLPGCDKIFKILQAI